MTAYMNQQNRYQQCFYQKIQTRTNTYKAVSLTCSGRLLCMQYICPVYYTGHDRWSESGAIQLERSFHGLQPENVVA